MFSDTAPQHWWGGNGRITVTMSYQFSDTTTYRGLVQEYEKEIGAEYGDVSGSSSKLKQFASAANQALDDFFLIALSASGRWQLDDSNHDDFPIIRTDIVEGRRDYPFTEDETGNLLLDLYRVRILPNATSTAYADLRPVDDPSEPSGGFLDGSSGVPSAYDKLGNAIRFNVLPDYSAEDGLELHINREASYFTYQDTAKKPGVPGIFHKYFYLKPALAYARRNSLASLPAIEREVLKLEGDESRGIVGAIARYYGRRAMDERHIITPKLTPYL